MPRDQFVFRKQNQLKKFDKSIKRKWDKKIAKLCEKINKLDNYYTTSSCSGRIVILKNCKEKKDDLFIKVWHDKISIGDLKIVLENIKINDLIYFKQEPCILHVACRNLKSAQEIHDLGKEAGWKRCGIIASDKRFVVELNATQKLEFPIFYKTILGDDYFLEIVVREANRKLEESWEVIERFEELIK